MRTGGLLLLVYIVIGVIVAVSNDYFSPLRNVSDVLNMIVAVLAWPLVLLGVDININVG